MMRSLRSRLLAWTIGGMALLVALFAVGVYAAAHRALMGGFEESLAGTARALAASVKQETKEIEVEFDEREMSEFHRPDRPDYFQLWGPDGAVLKRSTSLAAGDLPRLEGTLGAAVFHNLSLPDGRPGRAVVFVFLPRVEEEEEDGQRKVPPAPQPVTLIVARETAGLDAELAAIRWIMAGAAGATLLLTLVVAALVVRQGLRPLEALAARIAAVREDSLDAAIPVEGMPREMAPVGERLNDLLRRLRDVLGRERAFTADAAHELRTPLAGIRSTIEVALARPRKPDEYGQALADCLDIARQMQTLVDNLLVLTRMEGGQVALRPEVVRVAELLEALWRPHAAQAQARGIVLERRLPADLQCTADRDLLAMVVSNLLANAVEYANDGGRIEVLGQAADDTLELSVANTGCTLSAAEVTHVFDRFWRGDAARTGTGIHCGLGLSLVERAAHALGGAVSAAVSGGRFVVRLTLPAR
ncbi:MAG: sensor histidine kinase N-terminal domain-containing protein [Planctomycetes bacterium]|nr:sensor histidine kinase N-terminal domain-containing protein [Planctomycetota bacterium]